MHTIFMIALLLQAVFSVSVEICGKEYDTETTTRLDLKSNELTELPPEIGQLKKLQILGLDDNRLTTLPSQIKQLKKLQKLYLTNNKLTTLPQEIVQLKKLQILDLSNNKLTELPPEIGQLKKLQILGLISNKLTELPSQIVQLKKLQILGFNVNELTELPKEIVQLKNLQILGLDDNRLTTLPSQIKQLKNLKELYLDDNRLTELPKEIVQLKKLQILDLSNNKLTELPKEIVQLADLQILYLCDNELEKLPKEIGQLVKLQKLYLNGNKLTTLPQEIVQLVNLQRLGLDDNNLKEIPQEIVQLVNLQGLYLNNNKLETLPSQIGQLVNLQRLYLEENSLGELPSQIEKLEKLQQLDLYGNKLTRIPVEIGNLHNLTLLDLRCNNVAESSDDAMTMGKTELRQTFGDHVLLDDNTVRFEKVEIPKKRVYRNLMNESIHWNFDELKKLKPSSIPASNHTEQSLMEVWSSVYMKKWRGSDPKGVEDIIYANERILTAIYGSSVGGLFDRNVSEKDRNKNIARILALLVTNRDRDTMERNITKLGHEDRTAFMDMWNENKDRIIANNNKWTIDDFIHHIYNPGEEYRRWRIADRDNDDLSSHPSIVLARNLIGNILDKLCEVGDDDVVVSNINSMCEGLEYCPDRQIAEMRLVYQILTGEAKADSLDDFVRSVIGEEKERVFGYVVTPNTGQSVHVLNVLTNKMADEIGLNTTIETVFGTMGQDRFNGWPGNILRAFYSSFTPEHMFQVVKEHINGRGSMTTKALQLIYGSDISNENKLKMCRYREEDITEMSDLPEEEQIKYIAGESDGITEDFVRWYLTEMGIVEGVSLKRKRSEDESMPSKRARLDQGTSGTFANE